MSNLFLINDLLACARCSSSHSHTETRMFRMIFPLICALIDAALPPFRRVALRQPAMKMEESQEEETRVLKTS